MLYAFEDGPSGTLARGRASTLEIIRAGELIASHATTDDQISMSRDGRLGFRAYVTGRGTQLWIIELGGNHVRAPTLAGPGQVLDPGGKRVVRWTGQDAPAPDVLEGLPLGRSTGTPIWKGVTSTRRRIDLLTVGAPGAPVAHRPRSTPAILMGSDGETWACVGGDHADVGRGRALLGSVCWDVKRGDLFRAPLLLDLARQRLVAVHRWGITALGLDGGVVAVARPTVRMISAPVVFRDRLLVVAEAPRPKRFSSQPLAYEVLELDLDTLTPKGRFDAMPPRRLASTRSALVAMADGSLAWVPEDEPIVILPAPGTTHSRTDLVEVVGSAAVAVPVPTARWYDADVGATGGPEGLDLDELALGARRSLARYLLETLLADPRLRNLVALDAAAFAPYRDGVLAWSDERLSRLETACASFWELVAGASDDAVAALVERIEEDDDEDDGRRRRIMLLIGCGTQLALQHLARLARASETVAGLARSQLLEIPHKGPAVPRFATARRAIVAGRRGGTSARGLGALRPAAEILVEARGWACLAPPQQLLSIDLSLLPGRPLAASPLRTQQFLRSVCARCDEAEAGYVLAAGGNGRLTMLGVRAAQSYRTRRPAAGRSCPGEIVAPAPRRRLELETPRLHRRAGTGLLGHLGGRPRWLQAAEPPSCPRCERLMFFVGSVDGFEVFENLAEGVLYGFHCEDCGIATTIAQHT